MQKQSVERLQKEEAFYPHKDVKVVVLDCEFAHPGGNVNGGTRTNMVGIYRSWDSEPITYVIDPQIGPYMGQKLHETYVKDGVLTQAEVDAKVPFDKVAKPIYDAIHGAVVLTHNGHNDYASLKTMFLVANDNVRKHNAKVDAHNAEADRLNALGDDGPLMVNIPRLPHKPYFEEPVPYIKIDTFSLLGMKVVDEKLPCKGLKEMCQSWDIEPVANHNAGIDALACYRLFVVLCNRYPQLRRNRFAEMFGHFKIAHIPDGEWLKKAAILPADGSAPPRIDGQFSEDTVLSSIDGNPMDDFGLSWDTPQEQPSLKAKVFSRFFNHPAHNDSTLLE